MEPARIVLVGEGMIELSGGVGPAGRIGYGGDVLNMAIALARFGHSPQLLTALGRDPWSDALLGAWVGEGIDPALVARHPTRAVGAYGVNVNAQGERSFTYWRNDAAARDFFALPDAAPLLECAAHADLLILSGITLSLYDAAGRDCLGELAHAVRSRGGAVAFDCNYRARGWYDRETACAAVDAFARHVTIALPTLDDEVALRGESDPYRIAAYWHAFGAAEVVVKTGETGALVSTGGTLELVATERQMPVDSTGAGDAFAAGYLSGRLRGVPPLAAAAAGHRLAGVTIAHRGAIPPIEAVGHLALAGITSQPFRSGDIT